MAVIIEHTEDISSNFEGTIIDIETIGDFLNQYPDSDSRQYKDIRLVIFGFINRHALHIFCARGMEAINELKEKTVDIIDNLERPFYAFNCNNEKSVLFYEFGKVVNFDGELQRYKREPKSRARIELGIPNYDDPFNDVGKLCMQAWLRGEFDKAMAHNRACLLKERDILMERGFRKSDELKFVRETRKNDQATELSDGSNHY